MHTAAVMSALSSLDVETHWYYARICATCVDEVVAMGTDCPVCRTIQMVMRVSGR